MRDIPAVTETSLSGLSEHDWQVLRNVWARGIDWVVSKAGRRRWQVKGRLGEGFDLFKTKSGAYEAATTLVLMESRVRAAKEAELAGGEHG